MNIEQFRQICLSLPEVSESFPFGEDTLVFKVKDKMFALLSLKEMPHRCNLKCDPEKAIELRIEYPEIILPGYHMNKKHWNTIILDNKLGEDQIHSFILDSYKLVINSLKIQDRNLIKSRLKNES